MGNNESQTTLAHHNDTINMNESAFELAYGHIKELYKLCSSDNLSLTALQEKINVLDASDIQNISRVLYIEDLAEIYDDNKYRFLHQACMNKNVTLEIVKYLMDTFPNPNGECSTYKFCQTAETTDAHPLHLACYNEHCPDSVIEYLMNEFPASIEHLCLVGKGIHPDQPDYYVKGLPLHYYLSRDENVHFDTVKMLVEAYPQSLMTFDEDWPCYPIHLTLSRRHINLEIIEYLLELEPSSIQLVNGDNKTLLHLACYNEHLTLEVFKFVFNKCPEAIRMRDIIEALPIHALSKTNTLDEAASIDILRFMLSIDPTFTRERDNIGSYRPIDCAVINKSTEFCKVLIDVYQESLRDSRPMHLVCAYGDRDDSVDTIQYMLDVYPESINVRDGGGVLPIHLAAQFGRAKTIELLLKYDPKAARKESFNNLQQLPLHSACRGYGEIDTVRVLYDAYPEAIRVWDGSGRTPPVLAIEEERRTPRKLQARRNRKSSIVTFLRIQHDYTRQAKNTTTMTTPDEEGYLPLHRALLQGDASLGSIKLLVGGNTNALHVADSKRVVPLHIACRNATVGIVKFLVDSYELDVCDKNKDSVLHYSCRGGNLEVVKYFLDEHTSLVSSAEVNCNGELPIHLLCEAGKDKVDSESTEYIEIIWRMLLANPETVVGT